MTEELVEEKVKCDVCGKEFSTKIALRNHKNTSKDHKQTIKKEAQPESQPEPEKSESGETEEPQPQKQYLNIQDVQAVERIDNMAAWFDDGKGNKIPKVPDLIGLLVNVDRNESIPTLLMLAQDGTFIPPFLMQGFIGMFPEDYVFMEEAAPQAEENPQEHESLDLQAEAAVELQAKDGAQGQSEEKEKIIVTPPAEEQPKKKGILGIFNKKSKQKESQKEVSKETEDLLKQLKYVSI